MIIKISNELAKSLKAEQYIHSSYSIIKELVDNAIDAKAKLCKILMEEDCITVIDDGIGLAYPDLVTIGRFAFTSKEEMTQNVLNLMDSTKISENNFLGYRGQALFSIQKKFC